MYRYYMMFIQLFDERFQDLLFLEMFLREVTDKCVHTRVPGPVSDTLGTRTSKLVSCSKDGPCHSTSSTSLVQGFPPSYLTLDSISDLDTD